MVYNLITLSAALLSSILIDKYCFSLMAGFKYFIKILLHRKNQFLAEHQALKYYIEYVEFKAKQNSEFK